jgi:hypothetical protein
MGNKLSKKEKRLKKPEAKEAPGVSVSTSVCLLGYFSAKYKQEAGDKEGRV